MNGKLLPSRRETHCREIAAPLIAVGLLETCANVAGVVGLAPKVEIVGLAVFKLLVDSPLHTPRIGCAGVGDHHALAAVVRTGSQLGSGTIAPTAKHIAAIEVVFIDIFRNLNHGRLHVDDFHIPNL